MRRALSALSCVLLAACVVSLDAVVPISDATLDARLLGEWEEADGSDRALVTRGNGNVYQIEHRERDGKVGRYEARLGRVGGRLVLDVQPVERPERERVAEAPTLIRGHVLLALDFTGDSARTRLLRPDSLRTALARNAVRLAHMMDGDRVVLTDAGNALRRGLAAYVGRPGVFDDPDGWRRVAGPAPEASRASGSRPRARDLGVVVGILPPGTNNAITDVVGVKVGHVTLIRGDSVRTGVTAILPHDGNLFREKVPGAIVVGNGFGKLMGSTQVNELGEIETPILLTSTLNVPRVADALLDWMLALPGNETVRSVNPVVGETNDGSLNDIRSRPVGRDEVFAALRGARDGPVEEGSVGAGTGTIAFGWKGGIGTSSRVLPAALGGYTVGVLVQTNYGGVLSIAGAPVGRELGQYYLRSQVEPGARPPAGGAADTPDGSIIMVVATDAPADARNLERLASRALMGLARTGSSASNGSGDYVIAFSSAPETRVRGNERTRQVTALSNDAMSPLFQAAIEATEEAIYNSLFRATTVVGRGGSRAEALPIDRVKEVLVRYGVIRR